MPLEIYLRGRIWWVRGHLADAGEYIRESLGTSDEALANAEVRKIEDKARQRRILGHLAPRPEDELTFAEAVLLYPAGAKDAEYLKPLVRREGKTRVRDMTPTYILQIGPTTMPRASTDTWHRQIVTPIRSVINHAHGLGKCAPIKVRSYSERERVKQDEFRGRQSRVERTPGSWPWLLAFCEAAEPRDAALAYFMFRHGYRITQSIAMTRSGDMDLSAARVRVHAAKGHPAHWVDLDLEEVAMIANLPVPFRGQAKDRVFTIAGGRSGALYRRWKVACAKAEIEYLSPHEAGRHGYGTEMIVRQKVDPASAAEDKWASPSVMLKTYVHAADAAATVRDAFRAGLLAARTQSVQPGIEGGRKAMPRKTK